MVPVIRGNTRCILSPGLITVCPLFLLTNLFFSSIFYHSATYFPKNIAPDLWSVLRETLSCMGSTISFHQMTYCSVSLVLQPQLSSRSITLKCCLGIYSFYSTIMLIISICSSLIHCIIWTMVSILLHPETTPFSQWPCLCYFCPIFSRLKFKTFIYSFTHNENTY